MLFTLWCCPVCRAPLQGEGQRLCCVQGHAFDRAREGYVNLLLAHRRRSKAPGDDRQMLLGRREFLERGYYRPLAERLAGLAAGLAASHAGEGFALLDLGCGEGYYTARVSAAVTEVRPAASSWCAALDIAKPAVRMAARRHAGIDFAVASSAEVPLADHSLDLVLRIFAPPHDSEVTRLLRPGGHLLTVNPGARHLHALRRQLYDRPREHAPRQPRIEGLRHLQRIALDFEIEVAAADVARLLAMTPYYWQVPAERQARIAALPGLATEVAFCIDLYRHP
ncbi:methyltransferase domain-containing protein [Thiohalobacter sp. IOR34]|uniref:putative RNA methyltransferase n=1 Tax=Thiohalobacter sp. IOR34 TaxID=3057176 RepID=UPI0025B21B55|nr:methyltransferase domain-containing protein [Thiohalobacter sp. IOR34]WJW75397.1 methyltransferase domain-containing protein [Thiohalobacter sp. IOR34]